MTDDRMLEQEYRNFKRQAAPDLWSRIEENLTEHPEGESDIRRGSEKRNRRLPVWTPVCGTAAAAVVLCMVVYAGMHGGLGKMITDRMTTTEKMDMQMDIDGAAEIVMETTAEAMEWAQTGAGERDGEMAQAKSAVRSEEDMWLESYMEVETSADLVCSGTVVAVRALETDGGDEAQTYEILIGTVYHQENQSADMGGETIDVKSSVQGDSTALETGETYRFSLIQRDGVWEVLDADSE